MKAARLENKCQVIHVATRTTAVQENYVTEEEDGIELRMEAESEAATSRAQR